MRVTRFAARSGGMADRMADFVAHLRGNGMKVGAPDTAAALAALTQVQASVPEEARAALAAVLARDAEEWRRFDDLFDAFWFNAGRTRQDRADNTHVRVQSARPVLWHSHLEDQDGGVPDQTEADVPDTGEDEAEGRDGRLMATRTEALGRRDLREIMDETTLREAERVAASLARAIRDRTSRRRKRARRGGPLDLRRVQRASLARGGEPMELFHRRRPPRPMRIVALCDVSGSMSVHARVFLAFLRGLVGQDMRTDAYLFHTRLMRVTDALRDHDSLRAASRLSLMAEGFGGGTDISGALERFLDGYGARALGGRTVVLILSDGYCTRSPEALAAVLARLRRKARRVVWLNPLGGWQEHEPVARAMSAARPYLDAHLPAASLAALAALEAEFARI